MKGRLWKLYLRPLVGTTTELKTLITLFNLRQPFLREHSSYLNINLKFMYTMIYFKPFILIKKNAWNKYVFDNTFFICLNEDFKIIYLFEMKKWYIHVYIVLKQSSHLFESRKYLLGKYYGVNKGPSSQWKRIYISS